MPCLAVREAANSTVFSGKSSTTQQGLSHWHRGEVLPNSSMQNFARLAKAGSRAAVPVAAGVVATANQPVAHADSYQASDVLSPRRIQVGLIPCVRTEHLHYSMQHITREIGQVDEWLQARTRTDRVLAGNCRMGGSLPSLRARTFCSSPRKLMMPWHSSQGAPGQASNLQSTASAVVRHAGFCCAGVMSCSHLTQTLL